MIVNCTKCSYLSTLHFDRDNRKVNIRANFEYLLDIPGTRSRLVSTTANMVCNTFWSSRNWITIDLSRSTKRESVCHCTGGLLTMLCCWRTLIGIAAAAEIIRTSLELHRGSSPIHLSYVSWCLFSVGYIDIRRKLMQVLCDGPIMKLRETI